MNFGNILLLDNVLDSFVFGKKITFKIMDRNI